MIEQVYCTHCTYGTSALEQREGELADRVLGYSARAGSQERNELRNDYRSIERFLYYYLPSDTPPEEKQRLDAAAAPRRLLFCPSMGKLQMVGQVAYRQYDTADRLGSYFAHVLFAEVSSGVWSAADCLRLWGAPWVKEDSPNHPYKLPPLARLDDLWAGATPVVSDDALLRFLQTSVESRKDGGEAAIPSRWQAAPVQRRIDLLINSLQGLLALGMPRRENVLLVVEPSIAALVFYGVARLLPKSLREGKSPQEGLSFSTYEPNAERLPVTLAATTFFNPENTDVRSDLYRRRGLVINTYQDRRSEAGVPAGDYARFIVEQLLEEGWSTVNRLLENFEASGARRPEDLEILAATHRVVSQVLSDVPPENDSWRKSEVAARYLSREVRHELATAEAGWPQLRQVIGTPNHLTVLELVASDGTAAELQRPAQFLLKKFPPEKIAELVSSPFVGRPAKLEALVSYVTSLGRLPEGCQLLSSRGVRATTAESLLPALLGRLPEPVIRRLYETTDDAKKMELFAALVSACRSQSPAPAALKRPVVDILISLSDGQLLEVLVRHRDELRTCCPPPEPALARRLGRALFELPEHPRNFEKWLTALEPWKGYFQFPSLAERRMAEWGRVRACLLALRDREGEAAGGRVERLKNRWRGPAKADFKPLAEALGHAMPRRTGELDELAEVADRCALDVPQFKARLELASRKAGFPIRYDEEPSAANASADGNDLFGGPGGEVEQLRKRREQQARLWQLFRELEERLLVYADDSMGNRKLAALQQLGQVLVGRPDFLADGKQRMEYYFINGVWPTAAVMPTAKNKPGFKRRKRQPKWVKPAAVGVCLVVLVPLLGYGYLLIGHGSPRAVAAKPSTTEKAPVAQNKNPAGQSNNNRTSNRENAESVSSSTNSKQGANASGNSLKVSPAKTPDKTPAEQMNTADHAAPAKVDEPSSPPIVAADDDEMPSADRMTNNAATKPATDKPATDKPSTDKPANKPDVATATPDSAANDPPPPEPDLLIVSDSHSLPPPGPRFRERLQLKTWPSTDSPIKLALRGLTVANEHLPGQKLLSVPQADGQTVLMQLAGAEGGPPTTLAMLVANDHELSFQWSESGSGPERLEPARQWLRRCILRVTNGSESSYLSLASPLHRDDLGLTNGSGEIELHNLANAELPFQKDDEFVLGYGTIEIEKSKRVQFGDADTAASRCALVDLPDHYDRSDAMLELWRRADDRNTLTLRLVARGDKPGVDDKQLLNDHRSLQKLLSENRTRLESRMKKMQDLQGIGQAVQALARAMKLPDSPAFPGDTQEKSKVDAFRREIESKILTPVRQREAQLKQFEFLRTHAVKLSAVIYRQVEPGLYARYLVLGDPDQLPKVEQPASDDRNRED